MSAAAITNAFPENVPSSLFGNIVVGAANAAATNEQQQQQPLVSIDSSIITTNNTFNNISSAFAAGANNGIMKKESAAEMLNNSPGALDSADAQNTTKPPPPSKTPTNAAAASATPAAPALSNNIIRRRSNSNHHQHSQKSSFNNFLLHQNHSSIGQFESVRVEEALPFNPNDFDEPLQIKKLFTPGRNLLEQLQQLQSQLFINNNNDYENNNIDTPPAFTFNYHRKRSSSGIPNTKQHRKFFTKITHSVEKRNARERTRVHTVNQAFSILKVHLPSLRANAKRVSKLKILRTAIDYIHGLKGLLQNDNNGSSALSNTLRMALESDHSHFTITTTKNVSSNQNHEPKQRNETRMPKTYSTTAESNFISDSTNPNLASVFAGTNATATENPNQFITAASASTTALFNPTFDAAAASQSSAAALFKFPYMGYENLYIRSAAANVTANYYPNNGLTNSGGIENHHDLTLAAANHSLTAPYISDPSVFYYPNIAQAAATDYSALNPTNVYF